MTVLSRIQWACVRVCAYVCVCMCGCVGLGVRMSVGVGVLDMEIQGFIV